MKNLRKLEATHAVRWGEDFTKRNYTGLERYANVDDVKLKRAGKNTLEGVANALILTAERAEQEAIRKNPPRNDRAYVERSDYSITTLYSDYKDDIEAGHKSWTDYHEERKKWRRCKYMYCLNVFPIDSDNFKAQPAKRSDSRYCCEACRKGEYDAKRRYVETGSFLPIYFYLPELSESVGDKIREQEFASEADIIEEEINKRRPQRIAPIQREKVDEYPVTTYNIADLTEEEIKERKLEKFAEKHPNRRRENPYISRRVKGKALARGVLLYNFSLIRNKKEVLK